VEIVRQKKKMISAIDRVLFVSPHTAVLLMLTREPTWLVKAHTCISKQHAMVTGWGQTCVSCGGMRDKHQAQQLRCYGSAAAGHYIVPQHC
jgi:hypothetical protein